MTTFHVIYSSQSGFGQSTGKDVSGHYKRHYCPNPNLTSTQRTETQCQQYLSCYSPDFDETLKVGSCEYLEQIPTVKVTFAHTTFVLVIYMSILGISQLLPTRFWWNFKDRFLGTSRADSNCYGDICPGNICPRDICPYQEYLSCYWPDFDETL